MHARVEECRKRIHAECSRIYDDATRRSWEGKHMRRGVLTAEAAVDAVPETDDLFSWLDALLHAMPGAQSAADDADDEDGYGTGVVVTITNFVRRERESLGAIGPLPIQPRGVEAVVAPALAVMGDRARPLLCASNLLMLRALSIVTGGGPRCAACQVELPSPENGASICAACTRILEDARASRRIAPEMAVAEISRAIRAANPTYGEQAIAALEKRLPRAGVKAACRACGTAGGAWSAGGAEVCDSCLEISRRLWRVPPSS